MNPHSKISRPDSGEFEERYFDIESEWRTDIWSWIKFLTKNYEEWAGSFRGEGYGFVYSEVTDLCIVLTNQGLYKINIETRELIQTEDRPNFNRITLTPDERTIILGYYYHLYQMDWDFNKTPIDLPLEMDMIEFKTWNKNFLSFEFDEFLNWEKHHTAVLDCENWQIEIKE